MFVRVLVSVPNHCTCLSVRNDAAIVSFQHRNHDMMRTDIVHLILCGTVKIKENGHLILRRCKQTALTILAIVFIYSNYVLGSKHDVEEEVL